MESEEFFTTDDIDKLKKALEEAGAIPMIPITPDLMTSTPQEIMERRGEGIILTEPVRLNYVTRKFTRAGKGPINIADMIALVRFYANRHEEMSGYGR